MKEKIRIMKWYRYKDYLLNLDHALDIHKSNDNIIKLCFTTIIHEITFKDKESRDDEFEMLFNYLSEE